MTMTYTPQEFSTLTLEQRKGLWLRDIHTNLVRKASLQEIVSRRSEFAQMRMNKHMTGEPPVFINDLPADIVDDAKDGGE